MLGPNAPVVSSANGVNTWPTLLHEVGSLGESYLIKRDLIVYVKDRPGHDIRYAIDTSKIKHDLGWTPNESFEKGLRKTVEWYLNNQTWWQRVIDGDYRLDRLGVGA